jgi:hypothetical protein
MSIFYENFLKKTTINYFFEEEVNTSNLKIEKLKDFIKNYPDKKKVNNLTINDLEPGVCYQQGNETYFIIKIGKKEVDKEGNPLSGSLKQFTYSVSFIPSGKVEISNGLALTFGLLKSNYRLSDLASLTAMKNYRDSTTQVSVGGAIVSLWKKILAYFKVTFPNSALIYRSDLEDHELAVTSNLISFLNNNSISKINLVKSIDNVIKNIENAKKYNDIVLNIGDKYYGKEIEEDKEITEEQKNKMIEAMNYFKSLVEKSKLKDFSKNDIEYFLSKFERKKIIRTYLYTKITQMSYGITKTKNKIKDITEESNIVDVIKEIVKQIKKDAVVEIKGEKIRIITNKQMVMFISDIKELIKDKNKTIKDKKKEIEELVDDFYANNIQTINYSKNNRYVVMA